MDLCYSKWKYKVLCCLKVNALGNYCCISNLLTLSGLKYKLLVITHVSAGYGEGFEFSRLNFELL